VKCRGLEAGRAADNESAMLRLYSQGQHAERTMTAVCRQRHEMLGASRHKSKGALHLPVWGCPHSLVIPKTCVAGWNCDGRALVTIAHIVDDWKEQPRRRIGQLSTEAEVDLTRTRLRQRQHCEASLEFKVRNGETVLIYPSNEKVNLIVENLIERARAEKKLQIKMEEVDLSFINNFELRTKFFQELIPGCSIV
jgi:hypothetical protein